MATFFSPLVRAPKARHVLKVERTGEVLADQLIAAFDSETRRRGLLAHDRLPSGSAMMIAPTNAIHTFFMKFPIDVLFVGKDGTVVKVRHALSPWRMSGAWGAHGVIELPADAVRDRVQVADRLVITLPDQS